jgi:uncharacterized protein (DUF58 family)
MRRRYHLHLPGLVYLSLVVMVGLASANRPNNLLVWVFAAMLAGVLLSGLVSGFMLLRVNVTRSVPRTTAAGEPLVVRYQVHNGSKIWPIFALFVREMPDGPSTAWASRAQGARAYVQHVAPNETLVAETIFLPQRRGRLRFGRLRCESVFPFGLVLKSVRFDQSSDTLVLPRTYRLKPGTLYALATGGIAGSATSRRVGPGSDFLGVREYRPGDSLRHVAWRRSATTGALAVVERSVDVPPRVHVVLDLRRATKDLRVDLSGPSGSELEERAISFAASLLTQADIEGYEVKLTVLGVRSPRMPMRRGYWHLQKALAVLGAVDLDAPRDVHESVLQETDRASTLVVHVDRVDLTAGGPAASHLTALQLESLTVGAPEAKR